MKGLSLFLTIVAIGAFITIAANPAAAQALQIHGASDVMPPNSGHPLQLNIMTSDGHSAHVMPTPAQIKGLADAGYQAHNGGTPPLLYNGGPVMHTPNVYIIYWVPPHLQNGASTTLSSSYQKIQTDLITQYFGHSLMNNNTQYYDKHSYITNAGRFAGTYVDKSLYPGKDCTDPEGISNSENCISDTDVRNEVSKVMGIKGWAGGANNLFMVFTSSNEGECMVSDTSCSYSNYCGYHNSFTKGSTEVIYAYLPYGNPSFCQVSGAPSPNSFPDADTASTAASHELTESITDPEGDAWFDSSGYEIGDECAYQYGVPLWDGGNATEQWNGYNFYIQTEYSNLTQNYYLVDSNFTGCFNTGPEL